MAAALQYLQEHDLMDYDALAVSIDAAVDRAHKLTVELRDTEAALSHTFELMWAVMQYAKTRPVKISECGHTRIACRNVQALKFC